MSQNHMMLLAAMQQRNAERPDDQGFKTADWYVSQAAQAMASGFCKSLRGVNIKDTLSRAGTILTVQSDEIKADRDEARFEVELPDGITVPQKTLMLLQHKLTSPKEDRDKDVLRTDGARLDPKAPLLWQHMHPLPVGKVLTVLEHTKDILRVASVLLDMNELTKDISVLIEAEVLRFSHGFRALEFTERKAEEGMHAGFEITKFEIMEASLVSVPSNTDAEMELYSGGKLASDFFKAKAKDAWDQRSKQATGVTLEPATTEPEDQEPSSDTEGVSSIQSPQEVPQEPTGESTPKANTQNEEAETLAAATAVNDEKRGASLNARNRKMLKEIYEDLSELNDREELSRGGRAICKRCMESLQKLFGQEDEMEDKPEKPEKPPKAIEDEQVKSTGETSGTWHETQWAEVRAAVWMAERSRRAELLKDLNEMANTDNENDMAAVMRMMQSSK